MNPPHLCWLVASGAHERGLGCRAVAVRACREGLETAKFAGANKGIHRGTYRICEVVATMPARVPVGVDPSR